MKTIDTSEVRAIVKFCSEECYRQHTDPLSVPDMFEAWMWVLEGDRSINVETILEIGRMVEPGKNRRGFRTERVTVGGLVSRSLKKVQDFHRVLGLLCDSPLVSDPVEFYREFENIHPFLDGNGRTGAILYNKMMGTMHSPQETPDVGHPEFWEDKP